MNTSELILIYQLAISLILIINSYYNFFKCKAKTIIKKLNICQYLIKNKKLIKLKLI